MEKYKKAIAAVVGAAVTVAAVFGVNVDPSVAATVVSVVTALVVYFVPNG